MGKDGITSPFPVSLRQPLFDLSHMLMLKHRVLLVCSQNLFGESMETILRAEKEIELVGPWKLDDQDIPTRLLEEQLSVVVIADDNLQSKAAAELTKSIIEQRPNLTVIRTGLSENVFRIFSSHTLPARGDNLLEVINSCINAEPGNNSIR